MFLAAAAGGTALAIHNDNWLTSEVIEVRADRAQQRLAYAVQPLGTPAVILPAVAVLYLVGRGSSRPELARRSIRGGASVLATAGVVVGLKEVFGRSRPFESPNEPYRFSPFSGHSSFPSGHASLAFAAAAVVDRETSARWAPYVVYPLATLVAWSRVHDQKHWTSDVVAGAALGGWTAWKSDEYLKRRDLRPSGPMKGTSILITPYRGHLQLRVQRGF